MTKRQGQGSQKEEICHLTGVFRVCVEGSPAGLGIHLNVGSAGQAAPLSGSFRMVAPPGLGATGWLPPGSGLCYSVVADSFDSRLAGSLEKSRRCLQL